MATYASSQTCRRPNGDANVWECGAAFSNHAGSCGADRTVAADLERANRIARDAVDTFNRAITRGASGAVDH
jgi:hypothetical protein